MNFARFCEFWCFSLGKQARFTLNFCSGMPLRKVHELTFLWFGLPGPLLNLGRSYFYRQWYVVSYDLPDTTERLEECSRRPAQCGANFAHTTEPEHINWQDASKDCESLRPVLQGMKCLKGTQGPKPSLNLKRLNPLEKAMTARDVTGFY